MGQEYEDTLRVSFRRLSTEELIERKQRGVLTPEAELIAQQELSSRGVSPSDYAQIQRVAMEEEAALVGLPKGIENGDLASPWRRLVAHLIDHSIAVFLVLFGAFIGGVADTLPTTWLGIFAYIAYYLLSDALPNGMSIGKRLTGIRVVGLVGLRPCTVGQALQRNLIMMIPIIGFLDMLSIFGRRHQRWGDRWAETIVISKRAGLAK